MIVVDTNIICYYWLDSPLSPKAEELRERDPDWRVPPLWRSEFRSALSQSVRHRVLALADAIVILNRAEMLLRENEIIPSSPKIITLSTQSGCTTYDCEFVALAQEMPARLVTADKQVLRSFPETAISLGDFLRS